MVNTAKKNWVRHVRLAIRKRWVQVVVVVLVWLLVGLLSVSMLSPKKPAQGDTSGFKFLHCDVCKMELPYTKDLDGKRCPKCQPPKTGFYVATETSIKGAIVSPWTRLYMVVFIETVVMLAGVVYLLYLPVEDPFNIYYVVGCPYCNQRLRFRGVSLGGLGSCTRCKRAFRFPDEDEAVREEDLLKAEEQAALVEREDG